MLKIVDSYCTDDLMLIPKYSDIKSRADIDISVKLSKGLNFSMPIVPSNMATITEISMARAMLSNKSLAILHRFMPFEKQLEILTTLWKENSETFNYVGVSVGVKKHDYSNVDNFVAAGVKIICIDVAHGHSKSCISMTEYIADKYPDVFLISGNTATAEGAKTLWKAGADVVKNNVGSGSICSTRIQTGNGIPVMTTLSDTYDARKWFYPGKNKFIMSDGGCKNSGDIVKCLCFADLIMAGSLVSGTDETPGDTFLINGKACKNYVGSSTHKTNHIEGVAAIVETKGPVMDVLTRLCEGLKSGCSYQGASNLRELKMNPEFVRITNAGLAESKPHINSK
jgi:IMP dehydrogenase